MGAFASAAMVTQSQTAQAEPTGQAVKFLNANDDIQAELNAGVKLIVLDPAQTYTWTNILVPSGVTFLGNGAEVKTSSLTAPILKMDTVTNIRILDIRFNGNVSSPYNQAARQYHVGVEIYKSSKVTVQGCDFIKFRGAGVSVYNYRSTEGNRAKIYSSNRVEQCRFEGCYYGFINWYYSEYGILSNSIFTNCRAAICSIGGNWVITGNNVVGCRAAFIATGVENEVAFSVGGNFSHGNVTGNTFNHSNDQTSWSKSNMTFGNTTRAFQGVEIIGVLPVTFTGNALWYTDLRLTNATDDLHATGCTISNALVKAEGNKSIYLTGCWLRSITTEGNVVINT